LAGSTESESDRLSEVNPPDADSPAIDPSPFRARWLRAWFWLLTFGPLSVWTLGTFLRMTIRDRYPIPFSGAVFYGTPLPLLFAVAVFVALRTWRFGWRRIPPIVAVGGLLQLSFWLATVFEDARPEPPGASLRIAFWNVSHGNFSYEAVAREIVAMNADVVTLTEAIGDGQKLAFWKRHCPGYSVLTPGAGIVFLVRGDVGLLERNRATNVCEWRTAEVTTKGACFKVAVVDFAARPSRYRKPGFEAMRRLLNNHASEPFILAGDFNTPPESVFMDLLRSAASNAFEQSGEGFRETWPVFAPLLTLDQLWGNEQIKWHRCRHLWSLRSDHRPVVAEFEIASSRPENQ
jgi:endonuclease/exonuclease/phosphatase (EEP) superfamily protein YafD